ncbi:helix-turn-helix domain-containing protein [Leifsonia poae]|uniref:helix-turn-helix domain-containing protein n=1 Tax=Leifsonia poae TaxID=110933 RepID=UPI003D668A08
MSTVEMVPGARAADVDELERALAQLEWTLLDFTRTGLASGHRMPVAAGRVRFHFVVSGSVEVTGTATPVLLAAGDFLLLSRVGGHHLRASEDSVVASGELELTNTAGHPLVHALPDVLVACGFVVREPYLASLIEGLSQEFGGSRSGATVMASRIATVIASAAVRSWVENGCAPDQWLVSVSDPHIARAIAAMTDDPGNPWTVESLARVARASRSVFAERFRALVGDSPTRFLTTLRMEQAKQLLRVEQVSVAEAAQRLGYGSDAAFSRAFRRYAGTSPATWRRADAVAVAND